MRVNMTITIDPDVKELLKAQAGSLEETMSNYIAMMVQHEEFYKTLKAEKDEVMVQKAKRLKSIRKNPTAYKDALLVYELEDDFKDKVSRAVSKRAKAEKGEELMKKVVEEVKAAGEHKDHLG